MATAKNASGSRRSFSSETKLEAVGMVKSGTPRPDVARKFNITQSRLSEWLKAKGGAATSGGGGIDAIQTSAPSGGKGGGKKGGKGGGKKSGGRTFTTTSNYQQQQARGGGNFESYIAKNAKLETKLQMVKAILES